MPNRWNASCYGQYHRPQAGSHNVISRAPKLIPRLLHGPLSITDPPSYKLYDQPVSVDCDWTSYFCQDWRPPHLFTKVNRWESTDCLLEVAARQAAVRLFFRLGNKREWIHPVQRYRYRDFVLCESGRLRDGARCVVRYKNRWKIPGGVDTCMSIHGVYSLTHSLLRLTSWGS